MNGHYTLFLMAALFLRATAVEAGIPFRPGCTDYQALLRRNVQIVAGNFADLIFGPFQRGLFLFSPQADGGGGDGGGDGGGSGGDGGGSDGGGGSGTGAGGGGSDGTGTGTGGGGSDAGDSTGSGPDDANGVAAAPSAPSNSSATDNGEASVSTVGTIGAATVDVDDNSPNYGPGSPGSTAGNLGPVLPISSEGVGQVGGEPVPSVPANGGVSPKPVSAADVGINAVIVSGAPTPWEAVGKVSGVGNVIVTGGIVALGDKPLAKSPSGILVGAPNNPPVWLKLKPELHYLDGDIFPPIVPNVIDTRIISYTEEVVQGPSK